MRLPLNLKTTNTELQVSPPICIPNTQSPIQTPQSQINTTSNTRVILVRHGRSTYNEQGRYQGSSDESILTEKGRKSAYQTGLALKEFPIEAIYTSPLKRTQQTANEILAAFSTNHAPLPPLHINDKLKEIGMHHWEGLPFNYVREIFAEEYRRWKEYPHEFQMMIEDLRSLNIASHFPVLDLYEQAKQFWQELLPRHRGQTVLIVSHGGTNRALISTAIGLTPDRYHTLQQSNCGISFLNFPTQESPFGQLELLNFTNHLGEILPKLKEGKQGLRLLFISSSLTDREPLQKLAEFLQHESLDFSLVGDLYNSCETAKFILHFHPQTLQLQVLNEDLSHQIMRQIILEQDYFFKSSERDSSNLVTGLIVADELTIKSILSQSIGLKSDMFERLQLQPGTVGVIHYPTPGCLPIIQAINAGIGD
ncbi:MAG TPA: histidine phosphatase family protein [Cyanobacteria bacterium UBA11162]|nr:histidine phosphatase family protein [Cyanobacteria bacterium UBA11162]